MPDAIGEPKGIWNILGDYNAEQNLAYFLWPEWKKNARSDGIELKKFIWNPPWRIMWRVQRGMKNTSVIETENLISGNLSKMI